MNYFIANLLANRCEESIMHWVNLQLFEKKNTPVYLSVIDMWALYVSTPGILHVNLGGYTSLCISFIGDNVMRLNSNDSQQMDLSHGMS